MPGLIGTVNQNINSIIGFQKAFDELTIDYTNIKDELYQDESIIAQRAHLGIFGEQSSPFTKNNNYAWVEGEIYNHQLIEKELGQNFTSFSEILLHCYEKNTLQNTLAIVDGYFCAVIYDKTNKKILLISDRYGFKPLYFNSKHFAWSSELKSFKHFESNSLELNYEAISTFLDLGQFMGNTTYFKDIEIIDASTVLEYDILTSSIKKERYWLWSNIKQQNISLNESADVLYFHLKKAVESRLDLNENEKIGVNLSGGIDSRVLLSQTDQSIPAITFGTPTCRDYLLAKKVSHKKNIPHTLFELNEHNWFNGKLESIWNTDGMFNLMHMHPSPYVNDFIKYYSINLNGFAGDLNIGGGWITKLNSKISIDVAKSKFCSGVQLTNIDDSFYNFPHEDPYFIDNRVRRFTNMGTIQNSKTIEQRKPFFENDLIQFIYSIPDEYRQNGLVYNQMIKKHLKELFWNIPTTHSIYPVNRERDYYLRFKTKLKHGLMKIGFVQQYNWKYTNYEDWYYQPNFQSLIKELFKESILFEHAHSLKIGLPQFHDKNLTIAQIEKNLIYITVEI